MRFFEKLVVIHTQSGFDNLMRAVRRAFIREFRAYSGRPAPPEIQIVADAVSRLQSLENMLQSAPIAVRQLKYNDYLQANQDAQTKLWHWAQQNDPDL